MIHGNQSHLNPNHPLQGGSVSNGSAPFFDPVNPSLRHPVIRDQPLQDPRDTTRFGRPVNQSAPAPFDPNAPFQGRPVNQSAPAPYDPNAPFQGRPVNQSAPAPFDPNDPFQGRPVNQSAPAPFDPNAPFQGGPVIQPGMPANGMPGQQGNLPFQIPAGLPGPLGTPNPNCVVYYVANQPQAPLHQQPITVNNTPKPQLTQLQIYSGQPHENVITWLQTARTTAEDSGCDLNRWLSTIAGRLKGAAELWHKSFGVEFTEFEPWATALSNKFLSQFRRTTWMKKLDLIKQKPNSSLQHYLQIRYMVISENPKLISFKDKAEHWIDGLYDPNQEVKLLRAIEKPGATSESILEIARRYDEVNPALKKDVEKLQVDHLYKFVDQTDPTAHVKNADRPVQQHQNQSKGHQGPWNRGRQEYNRNSNDSNFNKFN
jgi:rRNA maturation protein Nop10